MRSKFTRARVAASALAIVASLVVLAPAASQPSAATKTKPLCLGKRATIVGTGAADLLVGTRRADVIVALGGRDTIKGAGGNDRVCAGGGDDQVEGGSGADAVDGGPGFDTCRTTETRRGCEETRPALPSGGVIAPGEYVTDIFQPALALRIPAGWHVEHRETLYTFDLGFGRQQIGEPAPIVLTFDSLASSQSIDETIARLTSVAGVTASAPGPATVGGASGKQVFLEVTEDNVVFPGMAEHYNAGKGTPIRFTAVNVVGRTATIAVAGETELDPFLPKADELLQTVVWRR